MKKFKKVLIEFFTLFIKLLSDESSTSKEEVIPRFDVVEYLDRIENACISIEKEYKISYTCVLWWGLDGLRINKDGSIEWIRKSLKTQNPSELFDFQSKVYVQRRNKNESFGGVCLNPKQEINELQIGPIEYDKAFDWFMPFGLKVNWDLSKIGEQRLELYCSSEDNIPTERLNCLEYNINNINETIGDSIIPIKCDELSYCFYVKIDTVKIYRFYSDRGKGGHLIAHFLFWRLDEQQYQISKYPKEIQDKINSLCIEKGRNNVF